MGCRGYPEFQSKTDVTNNFQHLLFTRVVPNLSRIGLITEKVRPLYDELGVWIMVGQPMVILIGPL